MHLSSERVLRQDMSLLDIEAEAIRNPKYWSSAALLRTDGAKKGKTKSPGKTKAVSRAKAKKEVFGKGEGKMDVISDDEDDHDNVDDYGDE
ncbi:hypothetical protein HZS61_007903 [Fusarium oxysporum f. sp. conglutinans]|uniref:Uncharacterized protein n=1 Tax=Fusarium oxysporum f. sp. conglutinans TaxID=100902 RepID=A0A8H6H1H2_FUSOX|nr:hypothetical protein HZS61_007903 [Fusarium oxysporum f. sp. conglutinans]